MAKKRTSKKTVKRSTKRSTKRRGGNWFNDLGAKIKNEFVNPQSLLRQQFYQDGPIRNALPQVAAALKDVPGLGQAADMAVKASDAAKQIGLGRMKKWIKYLKTKKHGKRKSRK